MLPIAARSLRPAIFKPSRGTSVRGTAPKVDGYYPLPSLTSRKVRLSFPEAAALNYCPACDYTARIYYGKLKVC
jgi:hypothetical protein